MENEWPAEMIFLTSIEFLPIWIDVLDVKNVFKQYTRHLFFSGQIFHQDTYAIRWVKREKLWCCVVILFLLIMKILISITRFPYFGLILIKNWLEVLSQHDFTKPEMSSSLKISRRKSSKGGNPMHVRDTFGLINGGSFYVIKELIW